MKMYELNLDKVVFWQRTVINDEVKYIKKNIDSKFDTLQFFKIGKPSVLPYSEYMWFRDCFSGRNLSVDIFDGKVVIYPCGIELPEESLKKIKTFNSYTDEILLSEKNMDDYIDISEDFLFNSYFCELINKETGIEVIPEKLLNDKIEEVKECNIRIYKSNNPKLERIKRKK